MSMKIDVYVDPSTALHPYILLLISSTGDEFSPVFTGVDSMVYVLV